MVISPGRRVFFHFLSAALSFGFSLRTVSVSQGLGGERRAGFVARGQSLSKDFERADRRVDVAVSGERTEKDSLKGRADRTLDERVVGDKERRLRLYDTLCSGRDGSWFRMRGREKVMK